MNTLKADGLYISAHNKELNLIKLRNTNYNLIGAAHNIKEINLKVLQGCSHIIFSRLFIPNLRVKISNILPHFEVFEVSVVSEVN